MGNSVDQQYSAALHAEIDKANEKVMNEIEILRASNNDSTIEKKEDISQNDASDDSIGNKKKKSKLSGLIIGSWNVHGWRDSAFRPNIERIRNSLSETPCDIFCIQESEHNSFLKDNKVGTAKTIKQSLNYKHESWTQNEKVFTCFVKLFCKNNIQIVSTHTAADNDFNDSNSKNNSKGSGNIKIYNNNSKNKYSNQHRIQLNILKYIIDEKYNSDKFIYIGIFVVHLHYKWESIRMKQLKIIEKLKKRYCDGFDKNLAILIIGDFNALRKNDYTKEKWQSIYNIRENNQWELPQMQVTSTIEKWGFIDCLNYLRLTKEKEKEKNNKNENENENENISKNNEIKEQESKENENENELNGNANDKSGNASNGIKDDNDVFDEFKINGKSMNEIYDKDEALQDDSQWKDIIDGRVSTCRYNTRIDFAFGNAHFFKHFHVTKVQHLRHNNASDHALLRIHCQYIR